MRNLAQRVVFEFLRLNKLPPQWQGHGSEPRVEGLPGSSVLFLMLDGAVVRAGCRLLMPGWGQVQ